jgi:hypothetical protein
VDFRPKSLPKPLESRVSEENQGKSGGGRPRLEKAILRGPKREERKNFFS